MLNTIRHWHWTLLHRVFGLPDHDHVGPHAHPPVAAHGRHFAQPKHPSLHGQLDREMQRQPLILKSWQQRIGATFERQLAKRHPQ